MFRCLRFGACASSRSECLPDNDDALPPTSSVSLDGSRCNSRHQTATPHGAQARTVPQPSRPARPQSPVSALARITVATQPDSPRSRSKEPHLNAPPPASTTGLRSKPDATSRLGRGDRDDGNGRHILRGIKAHLKAVLTSARAAHPASGSVREAALSGSAAAAAPTTPRDPLSSNATAAGPQEWTPFHDRLVCQQAAQPPPRKSARRATQGSPAAHTALVPASPGSIAARLTTRLATGSSGYAPGTSADTATAIASGTGASRVPAGGGAAVAAGASGTMDTVLSDILSAASTGLYGTDGSGGEREVVMTVARGMPFDRLDVADELSTVGSATSTAMYQLPLLNSRQSVVTCEDGLGFAELMKGVVSRAGGGGGASASVPDGAAAAGASDTDWYLSDERRAPFLESMSVSATGAAPAPIAAVGWSPVREALSPSRLGRVTDNPAGSCRPPVLESPTGCRLHPASSSSTPQATSADGAGPCPAASGAGGGSAPGVTSAGTPAKRRLSAHKSSSRLRNPGGRRQFSSLSQVPEEEARAGPGTAAAAAAGFGAAASGASKPAAVASTPAPAATPQVEATTAIDHNQTKVPAPGKGGILECGSLATSGDEDVDMQKEPPQPQLQQPRCSPDATSAGVHDNVLFCSEMETYVEVEMEAMDIVQVAAGLYGNGADACDRTATGDGGGGGCGDETTEYLPALLEMGMESPKAWRRNHVAEGNPGGHLSPSGSSKSGQQCALAEAGVGGSSDAVGAVPETADLAQVAGPPVGGGSDSEEAEGRCDTPAYDACEVRSHGEGEPSATAVAAASPKEGGTAPACSTTLSEVGKQPGSPAGGVFAASSADSVATAAVATTTNCSGTHVSASSAAAGGGVSLEAKAGDGGGACAPDKLPVGSLWPSGHPASSTPIFPASIIASNPYAATAAAPAQPPTVSPSPSDNSSWLMNVNLTPLHLPLPLSLGPGLEPIWTPGCPSPLVGRLTHLGSSSMPGSRECSRVLQVTSPSEVVLGKLIGRGCAGRVYRGTWRGEVVAIKVLTYQSSGGGPVGEPDEQVKKIEQEAALGICLEHPNIVATYAAFTTVSSSTSSFAAHQPSSPWPQPGADRRPGSFQQQEVLFSPSSPGSGRWRQCSLGGSPATTPVSQSVSSRAPIAFSRMSPAPTERRCYSRSSSALDTVSAGAAALAVAERAGDASVLGPATPQAPCTWETYIVMELCPKGSLRAALDTKKLHDKKGLPRLHEILPLAWEVACALQYLHANGVVHGDLKTANVMLADTLGPAAEKKTKKVAKGSTGAEPPVAAAQADGIGDSVGGSLGGARRMAPLLSLRKGPRPMYTAKIADFSHSRLVEQALRRLRERGSGAGAGEGEMAPDEMASPSHAAPELFEDGGRPTLQSDIYSLGVVLWELYGGRKPYDKYTVGEVLAAKRTVPTDHILTLPDSWDPEYAALCRRCWQPHGQRPALDGIVTTLVLLCRTRLPYVQLCYATAVDPEAEEEEAEQSDAGPVVMVEELGRERDAVLAAGAACAAKAVEGSVDGEDVLAQLLGPEMASMLQAGTFIDARGESARGGALESGATATMFPQLPDSPYLSETPGPGGGPGGAHSPMLLFGPYTPLESMCGGEWPLSYIQASGTERLSGYPASGSAADAGTRSAGRSMAGQGQHAAAGAPVNTAEVSVGTVPLPPMPGALAPAAGAYVRCCLIGCSPATQALPPSTTAACAGSSSSAAMPRVQNALRRINSQNSACEAFPLSHHALHNLSYKQQQQQQQQQPYYPQDPRSGGDSGCAGHPVPGGAAPACAAAAAATSPFTTAAAMGPPQSPAPGAERAYWPSPQPQAHATSRDSCGGPSPHAQPYASPPLPMEPSAACWWQRSDSSVSNNGLSFNRCGSGGGGGRPAGSGAAASASPLSVASLSGLASRSTRRIGSVPDLLTSRLEPLPETESCHLRLPQDTGRHCGSGGGGAVPTNTIAAGSRLSPLQLPPPSQPVQPFDGCLSPSTASLPPTYVCGDGTEQRPSVAIPVAVREQFGVSLTNERISDSLLASSATAGLQEGLLLLTPGRPTGQLPPPSSPYRNSTGGAAAAGANYGSTSVAMSNANPYVLHGDTSSEAQLALDAGSERPSNFTTEERLYRSPSLGVKYSRFASSSAFTSDTYGVPGSAGLSRAGLDRCATSLGSSLTLGAGAATGNIWESPPYMRISVTPGAAACPQRQGTATIATVPIVYCQGVRPASASFRSSTVHGLGTPSSPCSAAGSPLTYRPSCNGPGVHSMQRCGSYASMRQCGSPGLPPAGTNVYPATVHGMAMAATGTWSLGGLGALRTAGGSCGGAAGTIRHASQSAAVGDMSPMPPGLAIPPVRVATSGSLGSPRYALSGSTTPRRLSQRSRMFTMKELEAVLESIPRFGDASPTVQQDLRAGAL